MFSSRAWATRKRSAGSGWNGSGNRVAATATAGVSGSSRIPGIASSNSSQRSTSMVRPRRPLFTNIATSQQLMADTRHARPSLSSADKAGFESLAWSPFTHQMSTWVSSRITPGPPMRCRRPDRRAPRNGSRIRATPAVGVWHARSWRSIGTHLQSGSPVIRDHHGFTSGFDLPEQGERLGFELRFGHFTGTRRHRSA